MTAESHTVYRVRRGALYLARASAGYDTWTDDRDRATAYRRWGWARRAARRKGAVVEVGTSYDGEKDYPPRAE
jgi:hypothetical protein